MELHVFGESFSVEWSEWADSAEAIVDHENSCGEKLISACCKGIRIHALVSTPLCVFFSWEFLGLLYAEDIERSAGDSCQFFRCATNSRNEWCR